MTESEQHRANSEAILQREGVPFIKHLPMVEPLAETNFRTTQEVTDRTIGLLLAAIYGASADRELLARMTKHWGAADLFTPKERAFFAIKEPTDHERAQFSWRYEAVWVLVWSLGFVDELSRPDEIVDIDVLAPLISNLGPDGFRSKAKLRDGALDALDLTYRYHWACVDARINGREAPAGLSSSVVMERHYALNWLTNYGDSDWDDVSTDT